jgi:hypothetical protein
MFRRLESSLPSWIRRKISFASDNQFCPHVLVPHAAELMAGNYVFAWTFELSLHGGDVAGYYHGIDICAFDEKTMHDVRAHCPDDNPRVHGNPGLVELVGRQH